MDMEKVTAGIDLVDELTDEELNKLVDYIRASYKDRKNKRNAKARATLQVGTRVRFPDNTRPQYLARQSGVIEEIRQTRVVVKLDRGPQGKFHTGRVITPPGSLVTL